MTAAINELEVRKDLKIRRGSIVNLDFSGDGAGFEVEVAAIRMYGERILIESSHRNFCGPSLVHDVWQYEEAATMVRF